MFSTHLRVGVGAALVVLGLSVMYGWIFGVAILTSVLPGWPNMKVNPALCFVLLGLAFILIQSPRAPARIGAVVCGVAVVTIAGATVVEYLSGRDFGIDQLVVADRVAYSGSGLPGRMSPASALAFVLEGIAVVLLSVGRSGSSVRLAHVIAVCAGVAAFVTAAGYAFGAEALGRLSLYKLMAIHTAIAHIAACIAIVATRVDESWLAGYEQAPTARAGLLRFLPVSVGLPTVIGLALLIGAGLGLYNAEFALSLFVPLVAVLLIALGLRSGQHARDGEVALWASQAQLRERASLVDLSHDAVFTLDMGAVISSWNRAAEELYGWPSEEAVGKVVHDLLETTFPEPIEDIYATLQRTGRWEGDLIHKKRDGTQVIAASRWSLHRDRQGQPMAILETNNDVTEQRRATEELARSEAKYRDLFDHLPIAVVQTDTSELLKEFARLHAEGITDLNRYIDDHPDFLNLCASSVRVTQINAEAVKLFGPETAAEFMGNVARFFEADPGTMRRNAVARFAGEESITREMRTVTLDGRVMHLLYKNTFSRALSEMGIGLLAMIDITERRQAQESLQQAQSDIVRFNRVMLIGEMTASISHEINQPISGAITNANAALHWLAADPPDVKEVQNSLERIIRDGRRASDVIGRVRALARKTPPRKDPLDINEAVDEVLALTERELHSNSVRLSVRLARDLPLIPADRIQVQQVILNLVVNAVEAMSGTSEGHRELFISTGPDSTNVFVEVRDTGPGLEPEAGERLFQSFYTTKDGGMGMGLSLSRSIVEAHGGHLSAMRNEPNGAIFRFTLPVVELSNQ